MTEKTTHRKKAEPKHKTVAKSKPSLAIENPIPKSPHDGFVPPENLNTRAKLLVVVLFLLIALFVVIGLLAKSYDQKSTKSKASTSQPASIKDKLVNIAITSKGYNPSVVTIVKGDVVVWTNQDTAIHKVNSDPFPTDNQYSQLNSTIPLKTKYNYSFVFNQVGTYHYHDDLNPTTYKGTIIVKN